MAFMRQYSFLFGGEAFVQVAVGVGKENRSYKLLFSHAEMVKDLLLGFVKEEWVKELDFQTLEKVGSSYVSDDIGDRYDDIV